VHEARIATTEQEREAVYRHRYTVYVEELRRYHDTADHQGRRLVDPEDASSELVYVAADGEVVASLRTSWGGDGFSQRQIDEYSLAPLLAELPAELMNIGERTMISPSWRGVDLFPDLALKSAEARGADQLLLAFGACEPHLIGFYSQWQRPYADRNINHPESGYLIPLVAFPKGTEPLDDAPVVARMLRSTGAVTCSRLMDPDDYHTVVRTALDACGHSVFDGLSEDHLQLALRGSNVIRCATGDRIVRTDGTARTMYVVLEGRVSCRTLRGPERHRGPGEAVGRSGVIQVDASPVDAVVAAADTRVLALSERSLSRLVEASPGSAAAIAANGER
jgi:hypothetical protein